MGLDARSLEIVACVMSGGTKSFKLMVALVRSVSDVIRESGESHCCRKG
ncbi:hypothetical protein [Anaplasma marginale]|nr:hypothetical protein [Anaplasma marginale]